MLRGDDVARPYISYRVERRSGEYALVDSGADGSCLPLDVARRLGVRYDPARKRVATGAGGAYEEYEAEGDVTLDTELGPVRLTRPSLNPHLPFALLGRRDFFAAVRVCFDQRRLRMTVDRARR